MIFPENLKKGDTIGVTALSDGASKDVDRIRFENGCKNLNEQGYDVFFTDNVFKADSKGRSSDGKTRAEELHDLIKNEKVKAVYSAKGGNYLCEMLEYVDFELIRSNPKWIQGYSDNTGILYPLTTKFDIATLYGFNFSDFGMGKWEKSVINGLELIEGRLKIQDSFSKHEEEFHDKETGLEGYFPDADVVWRNARNEKEIKIKGRVIGGCLDVLLNLAGTKYDGTLEFIDKYKNDGILWYLESFDLNSEVLMMGLWQLKTMGWFEHASGIVFGRPLFYSTFTDTSYDEAVMTRLGDLDIPIIFDADIGHKGPQFVMINGAEAEIISSGGKGKLIYK